MYQRTDYDRPDRLLALLGTHWTNFYQGAALVRDSLYAAAQAEAQSYLDLTEAVLAVSRMTIPVYHRRHWTLLTLKQSDGLNRVLRYADGAVYGPQPDTGYTYRYGVPGPALSRLYPADGRLTQAPVLTDRMFEPQVVLFAEADYRLDPKTHELSFRDDPFENPHIPTRPIYNQQGEIVDREAAIWIYGGEYDRENIYTHFGYVLELTAQSSQAYKDTVNAAYDLITTGTSGNLLMQLLSAATGIPVARSDGEVVQHIVEDSTQTHVITDQRVYSFRRAIAPRVQVGQTLYAGQPVCEALDYHEFGYGPLPDWITSLHLADGWLSPGYSGGLQFANKEVPLQVVGSPQGRTKVAFEIEGKTSAVERFWQEVHTRGIAQGETLAEYLDRRPKPLASQPTAATLPETINPLQFLIEHILRFNTYAVRIITSEITSPSDLLRGPLLRSVLPPWTALIVYTETVFQDEVDPSRVSHLPLELFDASEPLSLTADENDVSVRLTLHYTDPPCD